jgi:Asp-tRNA(Asn)/Glu-tRNA(Gln) amidotransferase A subunit family amidase
MTRQAGRSEAAYDPATAPLLTFHDAVPRFRDGADTPRRYLERCLETIAAREPAVKAFAAINIEGARRAADLSDARYKAGRPLSALDGMPVAIKDLYETRDMPTGLNSPIFEGRSTHRDAAHVYALRLGGAVVLAKATTTEFGMAAPPATRNPFDARRTAGGSSSGSAAAIGAGMLPVASGSQIRGSIVRPAAYCGNYALKPSFGALNRGGGHSMSPSQGVLGIHAGCLTDMWRAAYHIADTVGGDPGQPGLFGEADPPPARRPARLVRLYSLGWSRTDEASKAAFERLLSELGAHATILSRTDDPRIEALERELEKIPDFLFPLLGYEMRWPARHYDEMAPGQMSETILGYLKPYLAMTPADYRAALEKRQKLRAVFAQALAVGDAFIAPSQPGPAPIGMGIGDPIYGDVSSCLGAPAITLPLLAVEDVPFGVQVIGAPHADYALCGTARWLARLRLGRD